MNIRRIIFIELLLISFLAVAGAGGEDEAIIHFSAQYAMDNAMEDKFINIIVLKTNTNWDILTSTKKDDHDLKTGEVRSDLNQIINNSSKIDEVYEDGTAAVPVGTFTSFDVDGQIYASPTIFNDLKISGYSDSGFITRDGSDVSASGGVSEISSSINPEILFFKNDIDSKLSQIAFVELKL